MPGQENPRRRATGRAAPLSHHARTKSRFLRPRRRPPRSRNHSLEHLPRSSRRQTSHHQINRRKTNPKFHCSNRRDKSLAVRFVNPSAPVEILQAGILVSSAFKEMRPIRERHVPGERDPRRGFAPLDSDNARLEVKRPGAAAGAGTTSPRDPAAHARSAGVEPFGLWFI
jgi:hypothetical protein